MSDGNKKEELTYAEAFAEYCETQGIKTEIKEPLLNADGGYPIPANTLEEAAKLAVEWGMFSSVSEFMDFKFLPIEEFLACDFAALTEKA